MAEHGPQLGIMTVFGMAGAAVARNLLQVVLLALLGALELTKPTLRIEVRTDRRLGRSFKKLARKFTANSCQKPSVGHLGPLRLVCRTTPKHLRKGARTEKIEQESKKESSIEYGAWSSVDQGWKGDERVEMQFSCCQVSR